MATRQSNAIAFTGFTPAALRLLAGLRRHNDRAWFAERKERIAQELLEPMAALVEAASAALARAKMPLRGDRKRSIFRIYRDVRFGHDKSPYRTNLAAYLSYDGERDTPGGVYIHIEPGASHLTIAFYRLPAPMLARLRRDLAAKPARFERVLTTLAKHDLTIEGPDAWDDSLKRMPSGFNDRADDKLAPYFRLRSFCARRAIGDAELARPELVDAIVRLARDARSLLEYGWSLA